MQMPHLAVFLFQYVSQELKSEVDPQEVWDDRSAEA